MLALSATSHRQRTASEQPSAEPSPRRETSTLAEHGSPRWAAFELMVAGTCAELHVWFLYDAPTVWRVLNFAVLAAIVGSSCWRRRRHFLRQTDNSSPVGSAWAETLVVTLVLGLGIALPSLAGGLWADDIGRHWLHAELPLWTLRKVLTVVFQQVLLFGLVYPLFRECLGEDRPANSSGGWLSRPNLALGLSAAAFGALHLPNPLLTLLTLVAGGIWVWLYHRHGRLLPLVASHLLLAIVVRETCYDAVCHMRVGADVVQLLPSAVDTNQGRLMLWPLSVQGAVDHCLPADNEMKCWGWAADVDGNRPADAILVVHQGEVHRYPAQRLSRPDVAQVHSAPGISNSGFMLRLPRDWFAHGNPRFFAEVGIDGRAELASPP